MHHSSITLTSRNKLLSPQPWNSPTFSISFVAHISLTCVWLKKERNQNTYLKKLYLAINPLEIDFQIHGYGIAQHSKFLLSPISFQEFWVHGHMAVFWIISPTIGPNEGGTNTEMQSRALCSHNTSRNRLWTSKSKIMEVPLLHFFCHPYPPRQWVQLRRARDKHAHQSVLYEAITIWQTAFWVHSAKQCHLLHFFPQPYCSNRKVLYLGIRLMESDFCFHWFHIGGKVSSVVRLRWEMYQITQQQVLYPAITLSETNLCFLQFHGHRKNDLVACPYLPNR